MWTKKTAGPVYHSDGGKKYLSIVYSETLAEHSNAGLLRDTRCLKSRCWGQWSVDTLMDSGVSEENSQRLNR